MSRLMKQIAIASLALTIAAPSANANLLDSFFSGLFGPMGGDPRRPAARKDPWRLQSGRHYRELRRPPSLLHRVQGDAISYSIAIPKEEARWSGVSYVSQKRENPVWTPTADMRRENPKLPVLCRWRRSAQSARHARALSRRLHVPHPRNGCALADRAAGFSRLHPHV